MADLDDFFAKKDKKKKTKKGFSKANTDVLAKNLEENDRKEQQAEEKAANDGVVKGPRLIESQTDYTESEADEWKEYEDKKLDYTNLKIDTLKIDEDGDSNDDDEEINEDGEKVKKSKEGAPWSKLVASDSLDKPSEIEEKSQEPVVKNEIPAESNTSATAASTKSSYVPPHLRNAGASAASSGPAAGPPRRQKYAPDISSEVNFPSLSSAMGADDPNKGQEPRSSNRGFEEVKSGGNQSYNSRASEAPKLSLDNKFAALRD